MPELGPNPIVTSGGVAKMPSDTSTTGAKTLLQLPAQYQFSAPGGTHTEPGVTLAPVVPVSIGQ